MIASVHAGQCSTPVKVHDKKWHDTAQTRKYDEMMILEFLEVDEDEDFIEIRDQWWFNPNSIQGATSWSFNVFEYVRGNDLYLVKFAGYILGTVPSDLTRDLVTHP